ncbi:hypothetical protein A3J98_01500 [candidate division WS6 bacterium RIFOXYC1_FULL_33_10]|uniref:DUF5673 domain-containing protein n=1 Tax=candidate division WS6 bacterium RIFOXYC1_FULL_33_10 TaxID=1802606 RepID=A0A1F4UJ58_9BACT|nr:MAG: hypothetical protein A3J98_01500 [candidate division WS6 bacterium RIFOXYC1_FULL_33_10]
MAKPMKKKMGDEFKDILNILSGEMQLREKEEKIKKLKEEAISQQKTKKRVLVASKELILEDSDVPTKKVVQNLKLFEWEAPDRYEFNFESKSFWVILSISLLFVLFLAILQQYYLMAAIIALLFFVYVSGTNKPLKVTHKITARGIDTGGRLYEWFMLNNFWFSIKNGQYLLIVETKLRYPRALIMLLDQADKDALFVLLQEKVLYKDIRKQGKIDTLTYGQYIPFEEI